MIIKFNDDFDLKKIKDSGQCFRVREFSDGTFRFIHKDAVLYIKKTEPLSSVPGACCFGTAPQVIPELVRTAMEDKPSMSGNKAGKALYEISAGKEEWENIWLPYFDAGRSYEGIRADIEPGDQFLKRASEFGKGIRILRQDPWEMLVTFIISQRKNIPAISKSVEMIAERFGKKVNPGCLVSEGGELQQDVSEYKEIKPIVSHDKKEELYLFPTPEELSCATEEDLRLCKLGYRAPYVLDAIRRVNGGELDLCKLTNYNDAELFEALKSVNGVGDKVSNCVCLYAYGRTSSVPIDTWIARIIELEYNGENPFDKYGDAGGIMQQWAFYYERETKK